MSNLYDKLKNSAFAKSALRHTDPELQPASKPYMDKCTAMGGENVACFRVRSDESLIYVVGEPILSDGECEYVSASLEDDPALYVFFAKETHKPVVCFPMSGKDIAYYNNYKLEVRVVKESIQDQLKLDKTTFLKNGLSSNLTFDSLGEELRKLSEQL